MQFDQFKPREVISPDCAVVGSFADDASDGRWRDRTALGNRRYS
jgi:hypothetical protein